MNTIELIKNVEYFFEPISTIYGNKKFYFYKKEDGWSVLRGDGKTLIRKLKDELDVFNFMAVNNVDLNMADRLFTNVICTRYINYKRKMKKIEKLIKSDVLLKAEEDWDAFRKNMVNVIKSDLNKPKLTLIKE